MTFEATHLGGVLALCTSEGWPTFPSNPDRALRALLAPGTSTIVALDTDGECGAGRMDLLTDTAQSFYTSLPHRRYAGFRLYPPGADGDASAGP